MPLFFNALLSQADICPSQVRLLRHQDRGTDKGRGPYELWRDDRPAFELYQCVQTFGNRPNLKAPYWASFVVTPTSETLLAGFYNAEYLGISAEDRPRPHRMGEIDPAGTCDVYKLSPDDRLHDLSGRLAVEWISGQRTWIQRADNQNKVVSMIRSQFKEPDFPGFTQFIEPLSRIASLPLDWEAALRSSRGVYLLTCPKTREQYVGSATGSEGFLGRWTAYAQDGHGGNVGLKSRDPSDYQVSILEVAGSAATAGDILTMEVLWKQKLQSREMGLNKN